MEREPKDFNDWNEYKTRQLTETTNIINSTTGEVDNQLLTKALANWGSLLAQICGESNRVKKLIIDAEREIKFLQSELFLRGRDELKQQEVKEPTQKHIDSHLRTKYPEEVQKVEKGVKSLQLKCELLEKHERVFFNIRDIWITLDNDRRAEVKGVNESRYTP